MGAAEKAAGAGIPTLIASGLEAGILRKVFDPEEETGTCIVPEENRLASRKHWIAYNLKPAGEIVGDEGAFEALVHKGRSLLPSGLKNIHGSVGVRGSAALPRFPRARIPPRPAHFTR